MMTVLERKVLLLQKGVTLRGIARKLRRKRSLSTISRVVCGKQEREGDEIRRVASMLAGVSCRRMFGPLGSR